MQASMRYEKANNHTAPDFDETKPKSWLIYQDCKFYFYFCAYTFITYMISRQQFVWMGNVAVYALRRFQMGRGNT